ncbi:MAG: helix-turn-helix domain-containing protein, partial [Mycobacterium sp.]
YVTRIDSAQAVVTIHFRPGGALPFLGVPLAELENSCVGLEDLLGPDSAALHERLITTPWAESRITLVESFLLRRRQIGGREPHRVVAAVLNAIEHDPSMRVSRAHRMTGLSPRRLATAFRAEVGLAPKAYQRVRRLQTALRLLAAGPARGATIAADLGYFDQAHFVREFREFTSLTPTQYVQRRSRMPGHVEMPAADT